MKKKSIFKSIVSIILVATMVFSILPFATISSSAVGIGMDSFRDWGAWELYSRGLTAAGTICSELGALTKNEECEEITSFISKWFFGTDTSSELNEIKKTCDKILTTTTNIEEIVRELEAANCKGVIRDSAEACKKTWAAQVKNVMSANENLEYDITGIYSKYSEYLSYVSKNASENKSLQTDKTAEEFKNKYIDEIINYYALKTNAKWHDEYKEKYNSSEEYYLGLLYTEDTIDNVFKGKINQLLNKLNYDSITDRYIDASATFAYYRFPFSTDQANFVDTAVQEQLNQIITVLMIYQDFLSQRAQYYVELKKANVEGYETDKKCDEKYKNYLDSYKKCYENFEDKVKGFLSTTIHLNDGVINATTTLDKYLRDDSASTEANNYQTFKLRCNRNYNSKITQTPTFYRNAYVHISKGKLVFTPFYVLSAKQHYDATMCKYLHDAGKLEDNPGGSYVRRIFHLTNEYKCLANSGYSDGNNTYWLVKDCNKFKNMLNPEAYKAFGHTPYSYFKMYLEGYKNSNELFIISRKTLKWGKVNNELYPRIQMLDINTDTSISNEWETYDYSARTVQKEKKRYAAFFTTDSEVMKTSIDTATVGNCDVTVNGSTTGEFDAGSSVDIKAKASEGYVIKKIKAQYHGDMSNKQKVTSEKVLCENVNLEELELNYAVPYSNVTIVVESIPKLSDKKDGKYIIRNYEDLCSMRGLVNSGKAEYVNGSYILDKDIDCTGKDWTTPIGTAANPFKGKFEGNNHTIKNLSFDKCKGKCVGLFGYAKGAEIQNLKMSSSERVHGTGEAVGIVCAYMVNGKISNCSAKGSLETTGFKYVGGIVGETTQHSAIEKCISDVSIQATKAESANGASAVGGVVGIGFVTDITDSAFLNKIDSNILSVGGIAGTALVGSIKNSYSYSDSIVGENGAKLDNNYYLGDSETDSYDGTTAKSAEQFANGEVAYSLNHNRHNETDGETYSEEVWYQNIDNDLTPDNYPVLVSNDKNTVYEVKRPNTIYSNLNYNELEKDANGNFIIETYEDLCLMAKMVNSGKTKYMYGSYILEKDIDCTGKDWTTPIGISSTTPFKGKFEGYNHTIKNLNFGKCQGDYEGLFGYADGAEIKNLNMPSSERVHSTGKYVGTVCAYMVNGKISNCSAKGELGHQRRSLITAPNVGGIVGAAEKSSIEKCISDVSIQANGSEYVGGVCGDSNISNFNDCAFLNKIDSNGHYVGGIAGRTNYGSINNSYSYSDSIVGKEFNTKLDNNYYLGDSETDSYDGTTAKSAEQFANGEVAYSLNHNRHNETDGETYSEEVWYQNIDNGLTPDKYPVLLSNDKNTVYEIGREDKPYSNSNSDDDKSLKKDDLRTYQRVLEEGENGEKIFSDDCTIYNGKGIIDNENKTITVYMADTAEKMGILKNQGKDEEHITGTFEIVGDISKEDKCPVYTDGNGCIFIKNGLDFDKLDLKLKYTPNDGSDPIIYNLKVKVVDPKTFASI